MCCQHIERWAFDVELLFLAASQRIDVAEVGVDWQEIDGSKLDVRAVHAHAHRHATQHTRTAHRVATE